MCAPLPTGAWRPPDCPPTPPPQSYQLRAVVWRGLGIGPDGETIAAWDVARVRDAIDGLLVKYQDMSLAPQAYLEGLVYCIGAGVFVPELRWSFCPTEYIINVTTDKACDREPYPARANYRAAPFVYTFPCQVCRISIRLQWYTFFAIQRLSCHRHRVRVARP